MLVYKALYRKMMDALKDAGMWLDWADQLKNECPDVAKYLMESAKVRLEDDFPTTHQHFVKLCMSVKESKHCLDEMVEDHIMDWYDGMMNRVKRWS